MSLQDVVPEEAGWKVTAVTITSDLIAIAVNPCHDATASRCGVAIFATSE